MKLRSPRLTRYALVSLAVVALLSLSSSANASLRTALPTGISLAEQASAPAASGDWPMYGHDYQRTNFNPDESLLNAGNVTDIGQRWQFNVGSNGTATSAAPSVSNGVVYVGSSAASPANNFFAFNAITGSSVFSEPIGYRSSCFNVGIGSTPAISGTQVVIGADTASSNPSYFGFNTSNGSQAWVNPMGVGASGFPWESPFLFNGRAYVGISSRCDNPSVRGELRAVDMTNGSTVGSAFFVDPGERGGGIWNSPALSVDGTIIAVGTGEDYSCAVCSLTRSLVTVDANSLAILQHFQEPSPNQDLDFGTTPVIFHDSLNRNLVAAGHKNGTFYAYDLSNVNGGPIWTRGGGTSVGLMPAYDPTFGNGGTLFIVNGSITAVDPMNGSVRWGPVSIGTSHGNIAIANGLIFVNVGSGGLQIRSESNGSLLRTLTPTGAGSANSGVAVSNGFIYWLSGSYINAWSLPAGAPTPTPGIPTSTATSTNTRTPTTIPTSTPTNTPTNTPPPATNTPSNTPTNTPLVPTNTRTNTPTNTPFTPGPTNTTCAPGCLTPTRTNTPTSTNTPTRTNSPVPSNTATRTNTPTRTPTTTRTNTIAPTQTAGGATATTAPSNTPTSTFTNTPVPSSTTEPATITPEEPSATSTPVEDTATPTDSPTDTPTDTPLSTVTPTPTVCTLSFTDVPADHTFYSYIQCLACRGIINGYDSGCETGNPCFRPGNLVTRGQLAKIVSNSAGFSETPGAQQYADVAPGDTFYAFVWRLADRGFINGYPCGGTGEPCGTPALPYFRPNANITRGQLSKIVANAAELTQTPGAQQYADVAPGDTFYDFIWRLSSLGYMSGYTCGGPGEPCGTPPLPYFRPGANATRGQASKIVANTFFPECQPGSR